jgi:sortase A
MKVNSSNKITLGILIWLIMFFAALMLLIYCVIEIWNTQRSIDNALNEWDKQHLNLIKLEGLAGDGSINTKQNIIEPEQTLSSASVHLKSLLSPREVKKGEVIGKITLNRLQKSYPIIEGTDTSQLAKGVGHYTSSVFPGSNGNSILAGHRDSVFRNLGELKPDDQISLETASGTFTYLVTGSKIVEIDDAGVYLSGESPILTLITCYPFYYVGNAPQRFLLFAKLVR